jgi:hypothetical protein
MLGMSQDRKHETALRADRTRVHVVTAKGQVRSGQGGSRKRASWFASTLMGWKKKRTQAPSV